MGECSWDREGTGVGIGDENRKKVGYVCGLGESWERSWCMGESWGLRYVGGCCGLGGRKGRDKAAVVVECWTYMAGVVVKVPPPPV